MTARTKQVVTDRYFTLATEGKNVLKCLSEIEDKLKELEDGLMSPEFVAGLIRVSLNGAKNHFKAYSKEANKLLLSKDKFASKSFEIAERIVREQ